jgi:hypothetical protein
LAVPAVPVEQPHQPSLEAETRVRDPAVSARYRDVRR